MKRKSIISALGFLILALSISILQAAPEKPKYDATYGSGEQAITVATGSPGVLGLLRALAVPFCQVNNCRINWSKKGSGASLKALKEGKIDMVMAHAPAAEKKAVEQGWATMRTLLGSNEFYIVGPESDPAGISGAKSAKDAYAMIARAKSKFFSRGDNSGTHKKELKIWKSVEIDPSGSWYITTKDFMGPTLMRADKELGYFMTDSSTFFARKSKIKNLKVLLRKDPILVNVYHALVALAKEYPRDNHYLAAKFVRFVSSPEGQKIFREHGKAEYGSALYNDAEHAKKWDK